MKNKMLKINLEIKVIFIMVVEFTAHTFWQSKISHNINKFKKVLKKLQLKIKLQFNNPHVSGYSLESCSPAELSYASPDGIKFNILKLNNKLIY